MAYDAIKLELIEWLTQLEDEETIEYLKVVKDSKNSDKDWWDDLTDSQKSRLQKGLDDINAGRVVSDEDVRVKYGI